MQSITLIPTLTGRSYSLLHYVLPPFYVPEFLGMLYLLWLTGHVSLSLAYWNQNSDFSLSENDEVHKCYENMLHCFCQYSWNLCSPRKFSIHHSQYWSPLLLPSWRWLLPSPQWFFRAQERLVITTAMNVSINIALSFQCDSYQCHSDHHSLSARGLTPSPPRWMTDCRVVLVSAIPLTQAHSCLWPHRARLTSPVLTLSILMETFSVRNFPELVRVPEAINFLIVSIFVPSDSLIFHPAMSKLMITPSRVLCSFFIHKFSLALFILSISI